MLETNIEACFRKIANICFCKLYVKLLKATIAAIETNNTDDFDTLVNVIEKHKNGNDIIGYFYTDGKVWKSIAYGKSKAMLASLQQQLIDYQTNNCIINPDTGTKYQITNTAA